MFSFCDSQFAQLIIPYPPVCLKVFSLLGIKEIEGLIESKI
nr:MAG TPA: hypothetical protein [Caudoviricetes sp.]